MRAGGKAAQNIDIERCLLCGDVVLAARCLGMLMF